MLSALSHGSLDTKRMERIGNLLRIKQFGVPASADFLTEKVFYEGGRLLHLSDELVAVIFRCKRMCIRHTDELDGFGLSQLFHHVDYFRRKLLAEVKRQAAYCQAAAEFALAHRYHISERAKQRHVRVLCKPGNLILGLHIIVVIMVLTNIEEAITFQTIWCMDLKAKANISHNIVPQSGGFSAPKGS